MATYFRYDIWVKTAQGPAIAGAQVYVCTQPTTNTTTTPPSPLASIFSDPLGANPVTQPLACDGFGHTDFYVLSGIYTVVVALGSVIQNVYPDQAVGTLGGINGVVVTGTPTAGQTIIATGPTTAVWSAIAGTTVNYPAVPNQWLNSYNAATGLFTSAPISASQLLDGTLGTGPILLASALTALPVQSVENIDGTLTIHSNAGVVIASINLANINSWTGIQNFAGVSISGFLADSLSSVGTNGQLLSSTGSGIKWTTTAAIGAVLLSPSADQTITVHNLLPASANTTQSLGLSGARWNASLGTLDATSINGTLNAADFSGSDIGAKINAAYAVCAARTPLGGRIYVPAGAYSFSTPIVFSTANTPVVLEGDPAGATTLTFTPTSGTAILFDFGAQLHLAGWGVRDLKLVGPGIATTATGIKIGGASPNLDQGLLSNLTISSFNIGVNISGGSFLNTVFNCAISLCTIGVDCAVQEENNRLVNCTIFQNATGLNEAGGGDIYCYGCSFDDNTTVCVSISQGSVDFYGCHFENVSNGTSQYITITSGGQCRVYGGDMQDDVTTGTQGQFINMGGSYIIVDGVILQSAGRTITQAVNFTSGNGNLRFMNFSNDGSISQEFNTSYSAGFVTNQRLRGDVGYAFQTNGPNSFTLLDQQPPAAAITGTGADATIYTYTLPGTWMSYGKGIRIKIAYLHSTGNASTTYKMKIGGTTIDTLGGYVPDTNTNVEHVTYEIFNNSGSITAQSWLRSGVINLTGSGQLSCTDAAGTSAFNMAASQALTFTFSVAATDKVTPELFVVELLQ